MKKTLSSALSILRKRAVNGRIEICLPIVPRARPIRRSRLSDYSAELHRLRSEGKTLEELADWVFATTGTRPHRSTMLRRLQKQS